MDFDDNVIENGIECPKCGQGNAQDSIYCRDCRYQLTTDVGKMSSFSNVCIKCGYHMYKMVHDKGRWPWPVKFKSNATSIELKREEVLYREWLEFNCPECNYTWEEPTYDDRKDNEKN